MFFPIHQELSLAHHVEEAKSSIFLLQQRPLFLLPQYEFNHHIDSPHPTFINTKVQVKKPTTAMLRNCQLQQAESR